MEFGLGGFGDLRANCEIAQASRIIRRFGEFRGIRSRLPVY